MMTTDSESPPSGVVTFNYDDHQEVANRVMNDLLQLMNIFHEATRLAYGNGTEEAGDAAPVVQGGLASVIAFMIQGGISDEKIREIVLDSLDVTMPQLRMAGMTPQGRA